MDLLLAQQQQHQRGEEFKHAKVSFKKYFLEAHELNANIAAELERFCRPQSTPLEKFAAQLRKYADALTLWNWGAASGETLFEDDEEYEKFYKREQRANAKKRENTMASRGVHKLAQFMLLWRLVSDYNRDLRATGSAGYELQQITQYALVCDPFAQADADSQFFHLGFTGMLSTLWGICYDTNPKQTQYKILDE